MLHPEAPPRYSAWLAVVEESGRGTETVRPQFSHFQTIKLNLFFPSELPNHFSRPVSSRSADLPRFASLVVYCQARHLPFYPRHRRQPFPSNPSQLDFTLSTLPLTSTTLPSTRHHFSLRSSSLSRQIACPHSSSRRTRVVPPFFLERGGARPPNACRLGQEGRGGREAGRQEAQGMGRSRAKGQAIEVELGEVSEGIDRDGFVLSSAVLSASRCVSLTDPIPSR
jgi:hypothetical protein